PPTPPLFPYTTLFRSNTDYRVGVPVTYRRAAVTVRFQLYHQSSHLGDEYMAHTNSQRVDLSFEAAELLVARDMAHWRLRTTGPPDRKSTRLNSSHVAI